MKLKRFGELNEGNTGLPKDKETVQKYIDKVKKLKDQVYDAFGGDDDILNGLDAAETRLEEILKEIKD